MQKRLWLPSCQPCYYHQLELDRDDGPVLIYAELVEFVWEAVGPVIKWFASSPLTLLFCRVLFKPQKLPRILSHAR
jgi:hypothetical protein